MADVRKTWHDEMHTSPSPSVAFFSGNTGIYLSDQCTIEEALSEDADQYLFLRVVQRCKCNLKVFGYEETFTEYEFADCLSPAQIKREIGEAVGIQTDDYQLYCDGAPLDLNQSFNAQGFNAGELIVDLEIIVNIDVENDNIKKQFCGSSTIGDVRQELGLDDDTVLVVTEPRRRMLNDSLHLCHVANSIYESQLPMNLITEKKITMCFEPTGLPHLRQHVAVALSSWPLDIYDTVSAQFELTNEFQLAVEGQALEKNKSLNEQGIGCDSVIQLDIMHICKVNDLWEDFQRYDGVVYLYSTENSDGLLIKDLTDEQRLIYNGFDNLNMFGSMLDVFGVNSGQRKSILLFDRDVERNVAFLSFNEVMRKRAWAQNLMLDILPLSRGINPKEVMCFSDLISTKLSLRQAYVPGDAFISLDPLKVVVKDAKKLQVHRLPHGATRNDLQAKLQQLKSRRQVVEKLRRRPIPCEPINSSMDIELFLLTNACRFRTKVTVSFAHESYQCCFEEEKVHLTDILIDIGKKSKVSPRTLFDHKLFCVGCGRKISKEEEDIQTIPSDCCKTRSLKLTDRKKKGKRLFCLFGVNYQILCLADAGVQSVVPRNKEKATYTLYNEERGELTVLFKYCLLAFKIIFL